MINVRQRLKKLEAKYGERDCQCHGIERPEIALLEEYAGYPEFPVRPNSEDDARALDFSCKKHGKIGPRLTVVATSFSCMYAERMKGTSIAT